MKLSVKVLLLIAALALFSKIVQIGVTSEYSTNGITLTQLEQQIADLQTNNMILTEKVYSQLSYTSLSEKAAKLGFGKPDKNTSLVITAPASEPIALNQ